MTETKNGSILDFSSSSFLKCQMKINSLLENIIRMNLLAFSSIIPDFEVIYLSHGIHQYLGVLQDIYTDDIDIQERTKSLPENSDTL